MLYQFFKWFFYLTVKGYFRSIHITGKENIPVDGPVIFYANHSSAFMDPILLAVHLKRSVYFLARGESFTSKLVNFIFNLFHMIPVYRPEYSPNEVHKNKAVFQKCYDHLKHGKCMIIFPEGISKTERRLRKIKTGTARIALGAEEQNDFSLGVQLVPIGINYSNPHHFQSDVFIKIGKAFTLQEFKEEYNNEPVVTVNTITRKIRKSLESLTVIIEDERLDKLINQIETLYRSQLRDDSIKGKKAPQDFYISKEIVKGVEHYRSVKPLETIEFENRIDNYLATLKKLNIRDRQMRSNRMTMHLLPRIVYFILGFPVFLYGYLGNVIPYRIAEFLSKRIRVRKDFVGSMKIAFGMFVFLFLYIAESVLIGSLFGWTWAILFALTLYPAGVFTINYIKQYYLFRSSIHYVNVFMRESDLIAKLKLERNELIQKLEDGRKLYDQVFVREKDTIVNSI